MNILVVTAHPDDIDIFCGGTIAKYCKNGNEVILAVCKKVKKYEERKKEQRRAAEILGYEKIFFFDDAKEDVVNELKKLIKRFKIDTIFTFDPIYPSINTLNFFKKVNPEHVKIGEFVLEAIKGMKINVYFFATKRPNVFVDIEKYKEKKLNAIKEHKTQFGNLFRYFLLRILLKIFHTKYGKKIKVKCAEAFRKFLKKRKSW